MQTFTRDREKKWYNVLSFDEYMGQKASIA